MSNRQGADYSDESIERQLAELSLIMESQSEADSICYPELHHSCTGKEPHVLDDGYGFYGFRFLTTKLYALAELGQLLNFEIKTVQYPVLSSVEPYCLKTEDEILIESERCKFHGTTYITVSRGGYREVDDAKVVARVREVSDLIQRILSR